jgi:serine/threonine protein kinase
MRRLRSLRSNFSKLVAREKLLLQRLSNPRIPSMIRQYVDPLDDELVYFVLEDGGSSTVINLLRSSMMSSTVLQPSIIKQIMIDVRAFLFRHAAASLH